MKYNIFWKGLLLSSSRYAQDVRVEPTPTKIREIEKNENLEKISCTQTHQRMLLFTPAHVLESEIKLVFHAVVAAGAGAGGSAAGAAAGADAAAGDESFCNCSIIFCFSMNI